MENLAEQLFKINAIKFGNFTTKVGLKTPIYFDLRVIVSYPCLMENLADLMLQKINIHNCKLVCGVPYTALPIATIVAHKSRVPMVMRRKEAKSYGTKKLIEGVYSNGDTCLIIEDVVTSGSSILETVKDLKDCGIVCNDAMVLLNREQGGEEFLAENGIKMHSLLSMSDLMEILLKKGLINDEIKAKVDAYIASNKVNRERVTVSLKDDRLKMSYTERAKYAKNPVAKDLLFLMAKKETNLCVAADVTSATELLNLAEQVGPYICCLKTHVDIIKDFHPNFVKSLQSVADSHEFVIMEDRKFADIGKTVQDQYCGGPFKISSWAQLVTVHSIFGGPVLDAIKEVNTLKDKGVFLLAEASSAGCLIEEKYTNETIKLAIENDTLTAGVVCQSPLFREFPGFLQLTPGVQLNAVSDNLGQQYNSPEMVIVQKGADIAVVGRGIIKSEDVGSAARTYRQLLWQAYLKRIS